MVKDNEEAVTNKQVTDAILEQNESIKFTLPIKWWGKLFGLKRKIETIIISPAKMGTLIRCSELLADIPTEDIAGLSDLNSFYKLHQKHHEKIIKTLCYAWHNKPGEYPKRYEHLIKWVMSPLDMQQALMMVILKLGVQPFIKSIIITQQMRVMSLPESQRG